MWNKETFSFTDQINQAKNAMAESATDWLACNLIRWMSSAVKSNMSKVIYQTLKTNYISNHKEDSRKYEA